MTKLTLGSERLRGIVRNASGYAYPLLPGRRSEGIFLWHHGRCGSTVLGNMLGQHPDIKWYSEIYHTYTLRGKARPRWRHDLRTAQVVSGDCMPGVEVKGLPCQDLETIGASLPEFSAGLRANGFVHCIVLDRANILRKLISVQVVDQGLRSTYHQTKSESGISGRLELDVDRVRVLRKFAPLAEMLEYIAEQTEVARETLSRDFDVLSLRYEDHIEHDPKVAYDLFCRHVGVEPISPEVRLNRINTLPMSELLSNYQQVADTLVGTPYEWMLEA